MIALTIAALDLRRRLRDRSALVTAFVAPFVLAGIMGVAFGSGERTTQVKVALVDVDRSPVTATYIGHLIRTLSFGPGVQLVPMTETAGRQAYAAHRVSATIVLPARSTQRILQNQSPFVQLESSRARPLGKGVADAFFAAVTLREVVVGAASAALYADGARGPEAAAAIQHAVAAPSPLRLGDDRVSRRGGPLGYFAPSMAIVFLFLSVGAAANSVLSERAGGTMARLQAAPVGVGAVVAGKTLSILGLLTLSVLSMWLTTTLVFGAYWGVAIGVVVLSLATVLAIAAIGLFITVSARDLTAAQAATAGVGFLLALLGGNFFPPGSLPPLFEKLALLTPNGWALDGFTTLSLDRGQLVDIVEPVAVLLAIAAVIGAAALVRFRRTLSAVAAPA